ncbi:MAG: DegT/DnrJ/EryC1/StrS family aminotransferase [Gemmatimonadota bacterium]|nr:DegT/DnrJ/EryC1/StrS family aminotransferase [Gemmatimonadota bacterium]
MSLRRLPPVHSPITPESLVRGLRALTGRSKGRRAMGELSVWLERSFLAQRWHLVDSGTSALRLALQHAAAGQDRPRVALPAYGCYDLATACDGANLEVVLYDIDPLTLGPEWTSYEAALATDPAVVVLVHLYGIPVDLDRATALARARGVRVIEDAAQGAGGSWQGRALGSWGDYAVLSFGRGKGITGGGGGALLLHTEAALRPALPPLPPATDGARRLLLILAQRELSRPWLYWIPASLPFLGLGETRYQAPHDPTAMASASCGLLAGNLAEAVTEGEGRRRTAAHYAAALRGNSQLAVPLVPRAGVAGYLRFPIIAASLERAQRLIAAGTRWGVAPGYPLSLQDLPGFSRARSVEGKELSGARLLAERLVTLPTYRHLTLADQDSVVGVAV